MPLISVIIPLYNAEPTIRQTIQSVLAQTWTDFELIVVNDGSTDGSLAVVNQVTDSRLQVLSFANAGAAIARNRGLAAATGEFVAFIDADDRWTPDKLADQLAALQSDPEVGLAYSWTTYIDEGDRPICHGRHVKLQAQSDVYRELLICNFLESGSNPLIRRSVLDQVGNFDETLRSNQDLDLYLRIAEKYAFAVVPQHQILYRMSSQSITADIAKHETQSLAFLERVYAHVPESLQPLKQKSLAHLYKYLTLRGLEGQTTRRRSWQAARCLYYAIHYDPQWAAQNRRLVTVLSLKILAGLVLPPAQVQQLRSLWKRQTTAKPV